ncbi:NPIPA5 isoform 1, partial [Pan troglodytes]
VINTLADLFVIVGLTLVEVFGYYHYCVSEKL